MTARTRASISTDLRHGITIARIEVVRSIRAIIGDRRQLLSVLILLVALTPAGVFFLGGSFALGVAGKNGTNFPVVMLARAQVPTWIASMSVLFGLRLVERSGDIDHANLLLTTVSPRAIATGLVLAEYTRILIIFGLPLCLIAGAFALGAGTPLFAPVVFIGILPILAVGLLSGFTLGYLARLGSQRFGGKTVPRSALSIFFVLSIVVGLNFFTPDDPRVIFHVLAPLGAAPISPYADLILVFSPFAVTPGLDAVGAAVLVLAVSPVLLAVVWQLAPRVWYSDPPVFEDDNPEETAAPTALFGGVETPSFLSQTRTTRLIWWQWLRGVRAPAQFIHLSYFLFMSLPMIEIAVSNPRDPTLPIFVGAIGAFLAGGTFGMNPLGIEGSMLPSILSTPKPGVVLIRARILAGMLLWLPVTLVMVLGLGWYSTLSSADVAFLVAVVIVLTICSCTVALALGSFSPRFDAVQAFGGVEAPTPTTVSLIGHTIITGVIAGIGITAVYLPDILDGYRFFGTTDLLAQTGSFVVWSCCTLCLSWLCYQYAIDRLNTFTYA